MNSDFYEFILVTSLWVCAVADLKERRIPNGGLAVGSALVFVSLVWEVSKAEGRQFAFWAAVWFLARLVFTGMLVFPFFLFRMTGAGDVKMMSVIVAALGVKRGAVSVMLGLCLGAVLSLVRMLRHGSIFQRFCYLFAYVRRVFQNRKIEAYYVPERDGEECVIPLGPCLWIGAFSVILWMG